MQSFDLTADLPQGAQVVIEASAGTGKTYALAGLVSRYVVEADVGIDQVLVVTFTRAAAAELRERIRQRLVDTARYLAHPDGDRDDPLLAHLADGDETTRCLRLERAQRAVIDYDTATITTIHGFCQQVLATMGAAARHNPDAVLVQDTSELVAGVASDVLAAAALADEPDLPKLASMISAIRTVLNNPGIEVVAGSGEPADERLVELVDRSTIEIRRRLAASGSVTFDDLLTGVRDVVMSDAEVCRRIGERYQVALIDEFQDTDPVQWEIFSTVFGSAPSTLVLVGDPKQAIYSFRGGDIHTYLQASSGARVVRRTLDTNWRSDGGLVQAMNGLCAGLTLGDERIAYQPVTADPSNVDGALVGVDGAALAPIAIRTVTDPTLDRYQGRIRVGPVRELIEDDLAHQVADLLGGTRIRRSGQERALAASDVAVLIRAHSEGPPIQRALARLGIPSIITGGRSVTQTPAAAQWRVLLAALSRPADVGRARAATLTWFWGWTAEDLATATDEALADVQMRHEHWSASLRHEGLAALMSRLRHESPFVSRVLGQPDGSRDLTDLEHLAELLHQTSGGRAVSAAHLAGLLATLDADRSDEEDPLALTRRVDSADAAVQIMTVHAAKGLEFGVVCCPSLWNAAQVNAETLLFYDDDAGARVLDVTKGAGPKGLVGRHRELTLAELIGEHARLTYVALTRARHRTLVWWASPKGSEKTGLARTLFGADPGAGPGAPVSVPSDDDCVEVLRARLVDRSVAGVTVDAVSPVPPPAAFDASESLATDDVGPPLAVAGIGRSLDRTAGRWSFTAITRHASLDPGDDSLGDRGSDDETPGDRAPADEGDAAPFGAGSPDGVPLGEVGAGPAFGTMVHSVLEMVDFTADDLRDRLGQEIRAQAWRSDIPPPVGDLVNGILAAIHTPLGAAFGDRRLADVGRGDRLDELDFEIPLGLASRVPARAIGELVAARLDPTDPLRSWAQQLADGRIDLAIGGYLTGSIDLVVRLPDSEGEPRFSVVDYKSNRVSPPGGPIGLADFAPEHLAVEMAHHHYPLQALLYSVALHRYLRWRVPGYEPDRHLGPAGYLFLRGMVGPDTPSTGGRRYGVFDWHLPPHLVPDLSRLLAGEVVAP